MKTAVLTQIGQVPTEAAQSAVVRERGAQRLVTAFTLTGLTFLLLPGTFLGVWNLISISQSHAPGTLSADWIQAHGHAQVFGWIGTFIIGIGLYSLQKMQRSSPYPLSRGWMLWGMWTSGVLLRWWTNIYQWHWRTLLPFSAALELVAFLMFYTSVRSHRRPDPKAPQEAWIKLVAASSLGFLLALLCNLALAFWGAVHNPSPAISHVVDQRFLVLSTWGFVVLAIWGFNAKWLPVFIGLKASSDRGLIATLLVNEIGVACALLGLLRTATFLLLVGALSSMLALHIFERAQRPPKTLHVHATFPIFVRVAYVWLGVAAVLGVWAAGADHFGGIWGASRHALTVGCFAVMVFAIGQRVLPAFCGMKILFSPVLMLWSLLLLNVGCLLRVASEVPAYEGYWRGAWRLLPISAMTELVAVSLFAFNIGMSILLPMHRTESEITKTA